MDRIRVKMAAPGAQGFDYDSDAEGPAVGVAAMVAPMFEAMTSGKFEFTMTPRGEVSNVKLSPELIDAIKKAPGGEAGDDEKAEEKAVEQFKSMISQMAFVLPEKAPQKGETWQTEVTVANPAAGNQSVQTTYTYDGTREIDGTTFAVIKPSMKMELAGNPMMKMEMKEQKTDGEVLFNIGAGRLHSISINQNIALEIAAAGQAMPGTIDQKIELKVTPAEATPATPKPSSEAKSAAPAN
jgi:hypothetical protein